MDEMALGGCKVVVIAEDRDLVADGAAAEFLDPDADRDPVRKGDRLVIATHNLRHQAMYGSLQQIDDPGGDFERGHGRVEVGKIDDVVDVPERIVVVPPRG